MRQLKITNKITARETQSIDKYLNDISKIPLLNAEEEGILAKRIREGDKVALERMINANLRFVVSVAKQYQNQGLSLSDLINEGNIGLMKACMRFDETKGFKFISYAVWWIRQSILQSIVDSSRLVRLPLNRLGSYNKVAEVNSSFLQENQREPTLDELSEILNIKKSDIDIMIKGTTRHTALDARMANDDDSSAFVDLMNDTDNRLPDELLMEQSLDKDVELCLSTLTEKEVEIITLYYGLNGFRPMNLVEIGEEFNLTRERVRQIKESAIRKMRNSTLKNTLRTYLG